MPINLYSRDGVLGIPEAYVRQQLAPFFARLSGLIEKIPPDFDFGKESDADVMQSVIEWLINKPQFDRVESILRLVDEHVKEIADLSIPIERYRDSLNAFLSDSGKELIFNQRGLLCVRIGAESPQALSALSSGESQLAVILTHLSFSPAARAANVFIVDEPELSLHVKWQEAFVEAVQQANPELQIILATHSPSIILDRTDNCFDLSEHSS